MVVGIFISLVSTDFFVSQPQTLTPLVLRLKTSLNPGMEGLVVTLRDRTCAGAMPMPVAITILHGASDGSVGQFLFTRVACRVFTMRPKAELFQPCSACAFSNLSQAKKSENRPPNRTGLQFTIPSVNFMNFVLSSRDLAARLRH
jgi:hypothetical protein